MTIVGFHVLLGIACVFAGAGAMFSPKARSRHSSFGEVYFWLLAVLFGSAAVLSVIRWEENYHLFVLVARFNQFERI